MLEKSSEYHSQTIEIIREKLVRHLSDDGEVDVLSANFKLLTNNNERVDCVLDLLKKYDFKINFIDIKKNDAEAVRLREQGNEMFKLKNGKKALEYYTKSIGYAEINSTNLGLAYANRSAVLFENGLIDECLLDIQRAFASNYPESLKHKLIVREKNSKNLSRLTNIKYHEDMPTITVRHSQIQSSADCLEIKNDSISGRHIIATRDISIGEILAIEKPFSCLLVDEYYTHCHECLNLCYNLIPCLCCITTFYCSVNCRNQAFESYHKYECPISATLKILELDKLKLLPLKILFTVKNQFEQDLDLKSDDNYRSDRYKEIHNLITNTEKRSVSDLFERSVCAATLFNLVKDHTKYFEGCNENFEKFCKEVLLLHLQTGPSNFHQISELAANSDDMFEFVEIASGAFSFLSLLNHSCCPNVLRSCYGSTVVLRAFKSIKQGEQIFDNYGYHFALTDRSYRQAELKRQYYFDCNCIPCQNNWPKYDSLPFHNDLPEIDEEIFSKLGRADLKTAKSIYENTLSKLKTAEASIPCKNFCQIQETLKQCLAIFGNRRIVF